MGLGANLEVWNPILRCLDLTLFTVLIFDNAQAGQSKGGFLSSTSDMAEQTWGLVHHVYGENEKVHVVGISMGGMISQELAWQDPDNVRSLTLINTHGGGLCSMVPWKGQYYMTKSNMWRKIDDVMKLLYGQSTLN
eukprot:UN26692